MSLTIDEMMKLKEVGFKFEEFEHRCNPGRVFYYNQCEYTIGGTGDPTPCSEEDELVAKEGIWLPNEGDLMLWLDWYEDYDISINFVNETRYYYAEAKRNQEVIFKGSGPTLLCCLFKLVYKICRFNSKTCDTKK